MTIEKLSEDEKGMLACDWVNAEDEGLDEIARAKAIRIIDQQAARIAELEGRISPLALAVLRALADIRLERLPDGKVVSADPREAVPQCYALFALEMSRREAGEALLVEPPLGLMPAGLWRAHPEPDRVALDARRMDVAGAVRRAREAGEAPRAEWVAELVTLEVRRRRDVARGPEGAAYWTTSEAGAVGDELDELLAALEGWGVVDDERGPGGL